MVERLNLKPPSTVKIVLEKVGREITPADICPSRKDLDRLYQMYPDLAGDSTSIGPSDDGNCQSWRGDRGWWRAFLEQYKV